MSVIAWDGKTIAADKQATHCDMPRTTTKLRRLANGEVAGWTGDEDNCIAMVEWYEAGADPEKFPAAQRTENWSRLIIAGKDGLRFYERQPTPLRCEDEFMAFGSGRDFAMGALAMGASAQEAVEIACTMNIHCGMGVDVMIVDETAAQETTVVTCGISPPCSATPVKDHILRAIATLRAQNADVERIGLDPTAVDMLAQELGGFTSIWVAEHGKYMLDGVELMVTDGSGPPRPLSTN